MFASRAENREHWARQRKSYLSSILVFLKPCSKCMFSGPCLVQFCSDHDDVNIDVSLGPPFHKAARADDGRWIHFGHTRALFVLAPALLQMYVEPRRARLLLPCARHFRRQPKECRMLLLQRGEGQEG